METDYNGSTLGRMKVISGMREQDHLAYNAAKRVDSVPLDQWLVDA